MINVIYCLAFEHDIRLVMLAAFICIAGSLTYVQLLRQCLHSSGLVRVSWMGISAAALCTTVWCTHFISMLSFQAHVPVVLDPVLTLVSLIAPMFGFFVATALVIYGRTPLTVITGNLTLGCSMAALHYVGMLAYRVDGIVDWDMSYVAASVVFSCLFTAASGWAFNRFSNLRFNLPSVALYALGVISLHFTGMSAMEITSLSISDTPMDAETFMALSIATAFAGMLVIALGAATFFLDQDQKKAGYEKLLRMAMTDTLTGLANRNAYMDDLNGRIEKSERKGSRLAVIGIDMDRFKDINDSHGHKAGDAALIALANGFKAQCHDGEIIARLGGDEFAATKEYLTDEELEDFLSRLQSALNTQLKINETTLHLSGSIGVARYPDDGKDSDTLRNNADLAMYRAKIHSSNSICFYTASMDEEARQKRELASSLAQALENNELELYYQLQASVKSSKISGLEALLRWTHPKLGPISPSVFIPIAEESGLIIRLGEWVLRRACEDAAGWDTQDKVAVNMSALQLTQVELPRIVHQTLLETGLPPHRLEIELTETAILEDRDRSLHVLRQIKALGVKVALDDFGTGYSSLEILRSFPFDKIKLDRFFMSEIEVSRESRALVRSVLSLGKSLSIPVLAEGVESAAQLSILKEEGCDEIQGFLLGRPERMDELIRLRSIGADMDGLMNAADPLTESGNLRRIKSG